LIWWILDGAAVRDQDGFRRAIRRLEEFAGDASREDGHAPLGTLRRRWRQGAPFARSPEARNIFGGGRHEQFQSQLQAGRKKPAFHKASYPGATPQPSCRSEEPAQARGRGEDVVQEKSHAPLSERRPLAREIGAHGFEDSSVSDPRRTYGLARAASETKVNVTRERFGGERQAPFDRGAHEI
jgi:hypothetical protein